MDFDKALQQLDAVYSQNAANIQKAYRKKILVNHPNKGGSRDAFMLNRDAWDYFRSKWLDDPKLSEQLGKARKRLRVQSPAANRAARNAAERSAKNAANRAARNAANRAARNAANRAAKNAANRAAKNAANRAARTATNRAAGNAQSSLLKPWFVWASYSDQRAILTLICLLILSKNVQTVQQRGWFQTYLRTTAHYIIWETEFQYV